MSLVEAVHPTVSLRKAIFGFVGQNLSVHDQLVF